MSWERDPLWAKARLFFERALAESRDEPTFGLWCSLGLELLARAALSSISPTLLAEPDNEHKYLLHALNRGSERVPRKSISASQVLNLCRSLFQEFSEDDHKVCMALINRRNEELHTGAAAFDEYQPTQWLAGFYRACRSLTAALGESLQTLFGDAEAGVAETIITEKQNDVRQRVVSTVAAHRKVFQSKLEEEKTRLADEAETEGRHMSWQGVHRVKCPACQCVAGVEGASFGDEHVTNDEDEIIVRQPVSPTKFSCSACGLTLQGYAELEAANLGGHYTRRTTYSPEEYYGLVHPDDLNPDQEYDNE